MLIQREISQASPIDHSELDSPDVHKAPDRFQPSAPTKSGQRCKKEERIRGLPHDDVTDGAPDEEHH